MNRHNCRKFAGTAFVAACLVVITAPGLAQQPAVQRETVVVTLHARQGSESELARVLAAHWKTLQAQNLVETAPHVTLRGAEDGGKAYFIEIFTWRDVNIPDNAPPEVQRLWSEMNRLRGSKRPCGIGVRAGVRSSALTWRFGSSLGELHPTTWAKRAYAPGNSVTGMARA